MPTGPIQDAVQACQDAADAALLDHFGEIIALPGPRRDRALRFIFSHFATIIQRWWLRSVAQRWWRRDAATRVPRRNAARRIVIDVRN